MELSSSNIFSKKNFFYTSSNRILHFSAQAQRIKKLPRENLLYPRKREPRKNFYISGNPDFLIFREMDL